MTKHTVHVDFPGRFVFIGFGSIGQGVLPLVLQIRMLRTQVRQLEITPPADQVQPERIPPVRLIIETRKRPFGVPAVVQIKIGRAHV